MAVIYTNHFVQFFDDDGNPLSNGKLYAYSSGTTTPKSTFTTEDGSVEHAHPVVLDSSGRATIFIEGSYRFDLFDQNDVLIRSTDDVTSFTTLNEESDPFFESFSGTGSQTIFTLSEELGADSKEIQVFVDAGGGEGFNIQNPSAYTLSGTTLTFNSAPASGTDNIYVFAPSLLVGAASTAASAAATSEANAAASEVNAASSEDLAEEWATKTDGIVDSTDYSAKAYAIGGTGVTDGDGAAKEWATKTGGTVDGTNYSAKYWATQADVGIVAEIATEIAAVAAIDSDVTTVAGIDSDVTTVAGIAANVTTVAGISADVSAVAAIDSDVTTVAANVTDVNAFANIYRIVATNPTTSLDEGDLAYVTGDSVLKYYNGTSWVSIAPGISNIVDDSTPQLGGDLDVNGNAIVSVSNGDIEITPDGTGDVILDGVKWPQADGTNGQVLTTDGAGQAAWEDAASIPDGDKGDIVVSSSGTVWTIDDNSVTLAKQASGTANRLIGYDGSGDPSEISAGSNITISGGSISATGGLTDVSQGDLNTSTGSVSNVGSTSLNLTLPGGTYGFYPQIKGNSADNAKFYIGDCSLGTISSYLTNINISKTSASAIAYAQQRYVTSSPPFDLGDGDCQGFIFVLIDSNGNITSHYAADVPPWGYNGPTGIRADKINRKTGKKYRKKTPSLTLEQKLSGYIPDVEYEEITQTIKNADMSLIPHPFGVVPEGHTVVMIDPMCETVGRMIGLQNLGDQEMIDCLLNKDNNLIRVDNDKVKRAAPLNVAVHKLKL